MANIIFCAKCAKNNSWNISVEVSKKKCDICAIITDCSERSEESLPTPMPPREDYKEPLGEAEDLLLSEFMEVIKNPNDADARIRFGFLADFMDKAVEAIKAWQNYKVYCSGNDDKESPGV